MTIRRNINGNIETIELTNVEMEKAFEIINDDPELKEEKNVLLKNLINDKFTKRIEI